MEQAIVVSFESDENLAELSVRPIDIIRDMIEDAESLDTRSITASSVIHQRKPRSHMTVLLLAPLGAANMG